MVLWSLDALPHCEPDMLAACTKNCLWSVQVVGPILPEPPKPLPKELDSFLQQGTAEELGAVYVSMGTAARLSEEALYSMAQGLSALPNPVVWKLSKQDLPGLIIPAAVTI